MNYDETLEVLQVIDASALEKYRLEVENYINSLITNQETAISNTWSSQNLKTRVSLIHYSLLTIKQALEEYETINPILPVILNTLGQNIVNINAAYLIVEKHKEKSTPEIDELNKLFGL